VELEIALIAMQQGSGSPRDGTVAMDMDPLSRRSRLATSVPPPR